MQREKIKDGKLRLVPLKNDRQRNISPPDTVFELLNKHKHYQAEQRQIAGHLWTETGLVFTNDTGGALDGDGVYKAYKKFLADNNLPNFRFHDLRHTAATLMLQNGDNIKTVQETLGHGSAGFTLDAYGHVTPQMKRTSATRMESFIKGIQMHA